MLKKKKKSRWLPEKYVQFNFLKYINLDRLSIKVLMWLDWSKEIISDFLKLNFLVFLLLWTELCIPHKKSICLSLKPQCDSIWIQGLYGDD